jgi:hypothetical protein
MTNDKYPEGEDWVWIAADSQGQVGAFVTGGLGPIPIELIQVSEIEDVEARLAELPRITTAKLLVRLPRPNDFIEVAERGFFAYDWSDVHRAKSAEIGSYELIAAPSQPVSLVQLPAAVARIAAQITLGDTLFGAAETLDVRRYITCIEGR